MNNLIQELAEMMEKAKNHGMPLELVHGKSKFDINYEEIPLYEICVLKQLHKFVDQHKEVDDEFFKEITKKRPIKFRLIKKFMKGIPNLTQTLKLSHFDYTVWTYTQNVNLKKRIRGESNENGYTKS